MHIILFTCNLMCSSKIAGEVHTRQGSLDVVSSAAELLNRAGSRAANLVNLDLNMSEFNPRDLLASLRQLDPAPEALVAYAPHVHEAKLAAAKEAGCDVVLSQGAFHRKISNLLDHYASKK